MKSWTPLSMLSSYLTSFDSRPRGWGTLPAVALQDRVYDNGEIQIYRGEPSLPSSTLQLTACPSDLRVGFLTYGLDRPLSGISRVAMELGAALQRNPECEVVFLTPYRKGPFADSDASSLRLLGCERLPGLMASAAQ